MTEGRCVVVHTVSRGQQQNIFLAEYHCQSIIASLANATSVSILLCKIEIGVVLKCANVLMQVLVAGGSHLMVS